MKADTLRQAIDYVLGEPNVRRYIAAMEAQPKYFVIHQIAAEVRDTRTNWIRVYINFYEAGTPNNVSKEDLIIDLQGTAYSNFGNLRITQTQI